MKKYNLFVGVFLLFSLGYLFHLDAFSQELLKERANGKTNIDLFLNNSTDISELNICYGKKKPCFLGSF